MAIFKAKINPRRKQLREAITADRTSKFVRLVNSDILTAVAVIVCFFILCSLILGMTVEQGRFGLRPFQQMFAICLIVLGVSVAAGIYVHHYNYKLVKKSSQTLILCFLFIFLLGITRLGSFFPNGIYLATACLVACAVILSIVFNQRFAIGMSILFAPLVCFAAEQGTNFSLFLTAAAGILTSCFLLKEVRTRMKLLEVGTFAAAAVFIICFAMKLFEEGLSSKIFVFAGKMAAVTVFVGVIIQAILPLIEKIFGVATSMTLLDYSDASQPLLRKLAMEAPGTFSHSLLIGSIAEAAANAIGANGLLCRVGAYYHDIGKIGKPLYFVENQIGASSRHEQLSPAMSQLIIVGHVKDGIEMAKEYGLPDLIIQFIETHHGTTLVEYFYEEAKKKANGKSAPPAPSEFRYPGPKPQTKEAAIVMLADAAEGAVRALTEITPTRIETVVHNVAMRRLQDGQFDECELTLRELSKIEDALSKALTAHHHGRIAYPKPLDQEQQTTENERETTS